MLLKEDAKHYALEIYKHYTKQKLEKITKINFFDFEVLITNNEYLTIYI